jgi:YD repeat-containing protein
MKLNRGKENASRQRNSALRPAIRKRVVVLSLGVLACLAYSTPTAGASGSVSSQAAATAPPGAVAVPSLFTAKSRTYKDPRGVYTTTLFGETVNVQEANGTWKPISASASAGSAPAGAKPAGGVTPNASVSSTASHDCALASNSPTTSICNATTDTVGYDGTNTDNSLVEFETKTALPAGANVLNAQLGMYLASASTSTAVSVSAYAATKPWTLGATWNTYDGTNAWASPGGDFSTTNAVVNPSVTTPAGWKYWYPTQIVQEWVNGTLTNDGLLLADTIQKTTKDMLSFNSLDASSNKPFLTIAWTPRGQEDPTVYTMQPFPTDAGSTTKVNLASGDLFVNGNDLSVSSAGPPLLAEHNYDSLNTEGGSVNPWYSLPGAEVYPDGSVGIGINRYDYAVFIRQPSGTFLTPRSIDATLCAVNGTTCTGNASDGSSAAYALTFNHNGNGPLYQQGYKIDFAANGGILSDADTAGNTITYHYGSFGISSITDSHGHTFTRSFHELKGGFHVTSAWTESGTGKREVKYAYNSSDQLEAYTDAEGHKTKYAYDEEGELKEITDPSGHVTKLTYESAHRIKTVTGPEVNGLHPTWSYTYYEVGKAPAPCTSSQKATVLTETNGSEEPPLTYCANVFDEVEGVFGYPATGQPGWYVLEDEADSESARASVNLASGNLLVKSEDIVPEAENHSMSLGRFYNLQATQASGTLGPRWRWATGPSVFLFDEEAKVILHGPNGYVVTLTRAPDGTYTGPTEYEGTLTKNADGTYTLTNEDAPTYQFNASGILASETTEEGNTFTIADTTVSGKSVLHALSPASGKALELTYDSTPHVTQTSDPASHVRHYEYNSLHQLKTYTDAAGGKTEYEYDSANDLTKITMPDGTVEKITNSNGKVIEVSITPPGGEASGEKFSYQAPASPTCNPLTDAVETVVTAVPSGTVETSCYNAAGAFTGPTSQADPEAEPVGSEEQPEIPAGTCYENPEFPKEDCGQGEPPPENSEGGLLMAAAKGNPDLPATSYGIADNNWLQLRNPTEKEEKEKAIQPKPHFNYFAWPFVQALHVTRFRRTIPWNMVIEAENDEAQPEFNGGAKRQLEDVEEWITQVKAQAGGTGQPLISFERCPAGTEWEDPTVPAKEDAKDDKSCEEAPSVAAYKIGVERFLNNPKHPILGQVKNFTPWNEPNHATQPTATKAERAGEYWRALTGLCQPKAQCFVAAGDFSDVEMPVANSPSTASGKYFAAYVRGMGHPLTAGRWAWHAYKDGAKTQSNGLKGHPREWWKRFRNFLAAVNKSSKRAPHPFPAIWLSEQGVQFAVNNKSEEPFLRSGAAENIMNAYVSHGRTQLTRQSEHQQIQRFYYYSTRGEPKFDSGLLEAEFLPPKQERRHPQSQPRTIYNIYKRKTPQK